MKTTDDFHEKEFDFIDKICGMLNDKGYDAEIINNMEQSPAVVVHLVDDEGNKVKYYTTFEYGGEE